MLVSVHKQPLVSVLMPVYNAESYLQDAIHSILLQTYSNFEFIIINDASIDKSESIILAQKDNRIRYFKNPTNLGVAATLNFGVSLAKGKYIIRMDADDISLSRRIEHQVRFMEQHPDIDILASFINIINAKGKLIGEWKEDRLNYSHQLMKQQLPFNNCLAHPSVIIKKEILEEHSYSTEVTATEDWELWIWLMFKGYKFHKLTEPLLNYRQHNKSYTIQIKETTAKNLLTVYSSFFKRWKKSKGISFFALQVFWAWFNKYFHKKY